MIRDNASRVFRRPYGRPLQLTRGVPGRALPSLILESDAVGLLPQRARRNSYPFSSKIAGDGVVVDVMSGLPRVIGGIVAVPAHAEHGKPVISKAVPCQGMNDVSVGVDTCRECRRE